MIWARVGTIIVLLAPVWSHAQSYTLKIETARLLVADAMANRVKDSIIQAMNQKLHDQEEFFRAQVQDFQDIIALHQQKFIAQQQISEAWMETAAEARKDAVKEKRKKNFFKITSGILTAGIIFLAVRE